MRNIISYQTKYFVFFWLLVLPLMTHAQSLSDSSLLDKLQNILIDAEAANTQLASITLTDKSICKELLTVHHIVHDLHSKIETMDVALSSSVLLDSGAIQVFDNLSSIFVSLATYSSDMSLNSDAIKCTEDMPSYNESLTVMLSYNMSMSTMLGLANDVGSMANHVLKMSDKILIDSGISKNQAKPILLSQKIQGDKLNLTQALVLVAQRNSLASVSRLTGNSYAVDFNSQIFTGHILSSDAATTFLTKFNMAREWGHIEAGVEQLVDRVNVTYKNIKSINKNTLQSIDADSYIAMAEMGIMVRSVAVAVDKMAITTERLSFSTDDEILRDSVNSMMRMSMKLVELAQRVKEMSDIVLTRGNVIGLTSDQLIAAQQLQNINYKTTLGLAESTQEKVIHITEINSL